VTLDTLSNSRILDSVSIITALQRSVDITTTIVRDDLNIRALSSGPQTFTPWSLVTTVLQKNANGANAIKTHRHSSAVKADGNRESVPHQRNDKILSRFSMIQFKLSWRSFGQRSRPSTEAYSPEVARPASNSS